MTQRNSPIEDTTVDISPQSHTDHLGNSEAIERTPVISDIAMNVVDCEKTPEALKAECAKTAWNLLGEEFISKLRGNNRMYEHFEIEQALGLETIGKLAKLIRAYGLWEDDEDGSPIPMITLLGPIPGRLLCIYEDFEPELYPNSDGLNIIVQKDFSLPGNK